MLWTDRQVELLLMLWNEGRNPPEIAARLAGLGRDAVFEKIDLLTRGSAGTRRASLRRKRKVEAGQISAGQHSRRFRSALRANARWRLEQRGAVDDVGGSAGSRQRRTRPSDLQARLFAALLTLQERNDVETAGARRGVSPDEINPAEFNPLSAQDARREPWPQATA